MATQKDSDAAGDTDWRTQRTLRLGGMDEVVTAALEKADDPAQGEVNQAFYRGVAVGAERATYLRTGEWITGSRSDPPGRRRG